MANVKFYSGTKEQYLKLTSHNPLALYFCDDTGELFKGDTLLTDGIRLVNTHADLPKCTCAADGVVYYVRDTRNGYMVSPDRTEWLQTIYAPVEDVTTIPESEIYNTVTTVGAVRDIEKKIYDRIEEVASQDKPLKAGDGIEVVDGKIVLNLADISNGLAIVDGKLTLDLASYDTDGAMSKEDKATIVSIPYIYEARKYDISGTPVGTLVDYRDHEIRIMCPVDTKFVHQTVGSNGNPNMYYMTFKAYAPDGAVSFKEGDRGIIVDEMFTFDGPASGVDAFGRKYSVCWLALATYDPNTDTWTYFGKNSTTSKYIGWDYVVEWYDARGVKIGFDSVRINLSNESCHFAIQPFYGAAATEVIEEKVEEVLEEKVVVVVEAANAYTDEKIAEISESYSITEF